MNDEDRGWALWNGPPGAWCMFKVNTDVIGGYSHVGTRQEAEAGREQFQRERGSNWVTDGRTYEIVRYDMSREPIGLAGRPSTAQHRALVLIGQGASCGRSAINTGRVRRETLQALKDRGWVYYPPHVGDFVLTALGRILAEARGT